MEQLEYFIDDLSFVETCMACPEQYDVFKGEKQVGYVRLRWGMLRAYMPDHRGSLVLEHDFDDAFKGSFENDKSERMAFLAKIAKVINSLLAQE